MRDGGVEALLRREQPVVGGPAVEEYERLRRLEMAQAPSLAD